jgi:hypothetical protein
MPKNESYRRFGEAPSRETKVHPIWRGIGFVFMILIPIMSYAGAIVIMQQNRIKGWVQYPFDLLAQQGQILFTLTNDTEIYIKLSLTLFLMFILFAIFQLFTFAINSAFGASRYGPYDLPPINKRVKKKAR